MAKATKRKMGYSKPPGSGKKAKPIGLCEAEVEIHLIREWVSYMPIFILKCKGIEREIPSMWDEKKLRTKLFLNPHKFTPHGLLFEIF